MKAIWDWIVIQVGVILGVFKDKTGKYSWKRVTGAVALLAGLDYLARGAHIEAAILIGYAGVMGIISAVTGT